MVVRLALLNGGNYRIKVKSDEYLMLHQNNSCTSRHILKALTSSQQEVDELRKNISDKFVKEFDAQVNNFNEQVKSVILEVSDCVAALRQQGCVTKRDVGIWMKGRTKWPNGKTINKAQLGLIYTGIQNLCELETGWIQVKKPQKPNALRANLFKNITA